MSSRDMLLWVWYFGDKNTSQRYEVTIELKSTEELAFLRVQIPVFSLISTSSSDIFSSKKGAYLSSTSLDAVGFYSGKISLDVRILNIENE